MPNGTQISYSYSPDGIRLSKTVSGVKTEYGYANGMLVYIISGGEKAGIERDSEGNPLAMCYNGTQYSYIKNAQGDIMGIRNQKSGAIVFYKYNQLGELNGMYYEDGSSAFDHAAANFNPLRYRGYVYDKETGFYYLNSRYYNPRFGRYINADSYVSTGQGITGNNMFAYCNNNSPLFRDPNGTRIEYMGGGGGIGDKAFNAWLAKTKNYGDGDVPYRGEPGGRAVSSDGTKERVYGEDGLPSRDRHYTDHDNPYQHPYVPHDHDWGFDDKGKWTMKKTGYPSPPGPLEPQKFFNANGLSDAIAWGIAGYAGYLIIKWGIATLLAAPTGGLSYVGAAITP